MRDHHWPSHWGLSLRMANEKIEICSKSMALDIKEHLVHFQAQWY